MTTFTHERVVNARFRRKKRSTGEKLQWDVYAGRGACPCSSGVCEHDGGWGNPYPVHAHGAEAMTLYLDYLATHPEVVARARRELPGKVLACWCAPAPCHAVVLARLADGETLGVIRMDALKAIGRVA